MIHQTASESDWNGWGRGYWGSTDTAALQPRWSLRSFCTPCGKNIKMLGGCPSGKDKNQRKTQEFKSLEAVDQSVSVLTQLYSWARDGGYRVIMQLGQQAVSTSCLHEQELPTRIQQNIAENSGQEQKMFHYCINTTKSEEQWNYHC